MPLTLMPNFYALFADMIAVIHFGYVAVVVFGLLIFLLGGLRGWRFVRNFWLRFIHLMMISVVIFLSLIGEPCPLTVWEHDFRIAAGQPNVCDRAFVARLVHQLIFFEFPPIVFTVVYGLFGLVVLASWWVYPPNFPWRKKKVSESEEPEMHAE